MKLLLLLLPLFPLKVIVLPDDKEQLVSIHQFPQIHPPCTRDGLDAELRCQATIQLHLDLQKRDIQKVAMETSPATHKAVHNKPFPW